MAALRGTLNLEAAHIQPQPWIAGRSPERRAAVRDTAEYQSFRVTAGTFWRRKLLLGSSVLLGMAIAVGAAYMQPRIYRARTSLEVQMPNEDYLNRRQLNPIAEPGVILLEPFLQTQMKLIQSDTMLLRVVQKLGLREHAELNPAPGALARLKRRLTGEKSALMSDAGRLEILRRNLTVRLLGQTQIMELLLDAENPHFAAQFLNTLCTEYQLESRNRVVQSATETAEMLSGEIGELKQAVDNAESNLRSFVAAHGLTVSDDRESFAEAQLRQTQSALGTAREARIAEQSRTTVLRSAPPEVLARSLDSDTLRAYRVKLTDLREQLAEAIEIYKPAHFKVRQIQAEIAEVDTAFEHERQSILARQRNLYDSAKFREEALRHDYDQQSQQVAGQMSQAVRFSALKRELETRRQLYDAMLQKVKEAGLVSAIKASNVRLIDPANIPDAPVKPNKPLFAALGATSGLFAGLVLVFARAPRPASREVVTPAGHAVIDLAHLGSIPRIPGAVPNWPAALAPDPEIELATRGREQSIRPGELAALRDVSTAWRAFQSVTDQILYSAMQVRHSRILTLTSSRSGEGRTTVACNVAAALAKTGLNVLLIDGDRMKPRLHEIFNIPNHTGLVDIVARELDPSAIAAAIRPTTLHGVHVLPAGKHSNQLPALAGDPRLTAVLNRLRSGFDVILLDAPPVSVAADVMGLIRHTDAVVFVVRPSHTSEQAIESSLRLLERNGASVIGKIVNHGEPMEACLAS